MVLQGSESKHVDSLYLFTNQVLVIKKNTSAGLKMSEFCAIIWIWIWTSKTVPIKLSHQTSPVTLLYSTLAMTVHIFYNKHHHILMCYQIHIILFKGTDSVICIISRNESKKPVSLPDQPSPLMSKQDNTIPLNAHLFHHPKWKYCPTVGFSSEKCSSHG